MKKFVLIVLVIVAGSQLSQSQPLNGNYTINSALPTGGTNFQSFGAFATALTANGVSGNVITSVVTGSGPYTEQVVFSNISGTGANATVTLDGNNEVIRFATTTTNRHVVRLSNLSWFNIANLQVNRDPASTGGFYGIHIFGTGNHITISGCNVDMTGTTSTLYGAYVASGSETSILETGDFHDITIMNNTSTGGGYGASLFGLVTNLASNIVISGNTFTNFNSNGVYLRETDGAIVSDNHFDKTTTNATSVNCIQLAQAANINGRIFNNYIQASTTNNGTMTMRGIYLFNGTGHRVYNNQIFNVNLQAGNFTAIEVRTGATAPEICYNTISLDNANPSTGDLHGIEEELSNTNSVLRNNIISITQPGSGERIGLILGTLSTPSTALNSNNNIFNIPAGHIARKGSTTPVFYTTLAAWQAAGGQDAASMAADPLFVAPLAPIPTNPLVDNIGTPIAFVSTDILGLPRAPLPDAGAYEFSGCTPPAVSLTLPIDSICLSDAPLLLSGGMPAGGTYSGPGVTAGSFNPSAAGTGLHTILYAFSDTSDCTGYATAQIFVDLCTGIQDSEGLSFYLSPNPAADYLRISLGGSPEARAVIFDASGKIVAEQTLTEKISTLNTAMLKPGLYHIRLSDTRGYQQSASFIISR